MKITPLGSQAQQSSSAQTIQTGMSAASKRAVAAFNQEQQPAQDPAAQARDEMQEAISAGQNDLIETTQITEDTVIPVPDAAVVEERQEEPALSTQYAALARREKALRAQAQKQEQAMRARELALKAREAELAQVKAPDYSNYIPKDQLKSNALQVLAEAGVSYEELTNQILNQGPTDPRMEAKAQALEAKLARLEQALEESQKTQKTAQEQQYTQALQQIEGQVKKLVAADPRFEMIKATGSYKDVVDLIKLTFDKTGEILDNEEASQQVEDDLTEEADRFVKIDKIKKRMMSAASTQAKPTQVQTPSAAPQQKPQMKTLTNSVASSRQLSAKERALLAFRGELK